MVLDDGLDKPDGVQQYILALGEWLVSQGHSVDYLVGETQRRDINNVYSLSKNIEVQSNGNSMTIPLPSSKTKIVSHLDNHQYDIIHVQTPYSPFMGGQIIKNASPSSAIVGTFHILPNSKFIYIGNWLLGIYCRRTLKKFDKMLSVSDVAAEFARKTFYVDSDILPNVVDVKRFQSASPFAKYDDRVLTILFLGRLVPRKGCKTLLEAINILVRSGIELPKFRVLICGFGPDEAKLKHYVQRNNLGDIVEFKGFVNEADKPRYYASADISVFPSSGGESFGIVLIEAMSSGRSAILAGNNPGYRSVLGGKPALLFRPDDPDILADLLIKHLLNKKTRNTVQQWAKNHAKQFDVGLVGANLLEIYHEALLKKR